ncbi:MAG: hypothetical protein IRZ26_08010 [Clostridia bacterium]|nr:hypothetical protein [Clostridia bacterium]
MANVRTSGNREGVRGLRKRVVRLMRQRGLAGVHRRRLRGLTGRDPEATSAPELVHCQFRVSAPNRLWAADIPSDHGSQYTSLAFGRRLEEAGILRSMGTVGDAFDSAVAKSFWEWVPDLRLRKAEKASS